jgi:hypothetical protein
MAASLFFRSKKDFFGDLKQRSWITALVFLVLSCIVLVCRVWLFLALSRLALSCLVLSFSLYACFVLCSFVLVGSCFVLFWLVLFGLVVVLILYATPTYPLQDEQQGHSKFLSVGGRYPFFACRHASGLVLSNLFAFLFFILFYVVRHPYLPNNRHNYSDTRSHCLSSLAFLCSSAATAKVLSCFIVVLVCFVLSLSLSFYFFLSLSLSYS